VWPRLTGDAVAVVIVLRIIARLAAPGGGEAHRARRAVRRCRGMPERHRQWPARKVENRRIGLKEPLARASHPSEKKGRCPQPAPAGLTGLLWPEMRRASELAPAATEGSE
jgi:hypothetical protein